MVNQQVLEGHWNEIKGKLRAHWASLSDDDLGEFNGNVAQLVGAIQRKTGESRDAVENYLEEIIAESGGNMGESRGGVEQAARSARDYSRYAAEQVQQGARQAGDRVQYMARQFGGSVSGGYAEAEGLVRDRPAESLAVCFGAGLIAGVVVGMMLRR